MVDGKKRLEREQNSHDKKPTPPQHKIKWETLSNQTQSQ